MLQQQVMSPRDADALLKTSGIHMHPCWYISSQNIDVAVLQLNTQWVLYRFLIKTN